MKIKLAILLILIVFLSGCVFEQTECGNNICNLDEDCNSCFQDCACLEDQYCNDYGICSYEICGDEICSESEINLCCEDCGCPEDKICNKYNQECQEKATLSEAQTTAIANNYLQENKIQGTIVYIEDDYYGDEIIKFVLIDCGSDEFDFPCNIMLYIDNNGIIIEEMISI